LGASSLVVVGFDTATPDTAACAWRDGEVITEAHLGLSERGRPLHATGLLAEVERCADAAGGWEAVDLVAVGLGPGSFTGLRVGIATAKGLRLSLGLAGRGVSTLDALGAGIGEAGGTGERLAVLDGYRGEVFVALYDADGTTLWEHAVMRPEALAERLAQVSTPPSVGGSGAIRFRDELEGAGGIRIPDDADPVHKVAARHICALAAAGKGSDSLEPIYLRPPDAERWRERDSFQRAD
jgi:tRNA threonylcarbamoyladenosine biosynthesis protein TsaB